jgi:hypothetical protein
MSREMFQNLNYDTILKTAVFPKIVGNAISESKNFILRPYPPGEWYL